MNSEFVKTTLGCNKTAVVGTEIYCLDVRNDHKGNIFIHAESGWILAYDSDSKIIYVEWCIPLVQEVDTETPEGSNIEPVLNRNDPKQKMLNKSYSDVLRGSEAYYKP